MVHISLVQFCVPDKWLLFDNVGKHSLLSLNLEKSIYRFDAYTWSVHWVPFKKKRVYTGHWVVINDPGKLSKVLSFRLVACMKQTIDQKSSLY